MRHGTWQLAVQFVVVLSCFCTLSAQPLPTAEQYSWAGFTAGRCRSCGARLCQG